MIARVKKRLFAIFNERFRNIVAGFASRVGTDLGTYHDNGADSRALWASMGLEPSLVLTPSAIKAGKLYSVKPEDGSGDFTVDRASSATYVDANGIIQTAAENEPRIDHSSGSPALLVEGQSTNQISWSNQIRSTSGWDIAKFVFSEDIAQSPDGTNNGIKAKIGDGQSGGYFGFNSSITIDKKYTCSIFAKKGEFDVLQIAPSSGFTASHQNYNLSTGLLGAGSAESSGGVANMEYIGNGWYRCSLTMTATQTTSIGRMVFSIVESDQSGRISTSITGDGIKGLYVFGSQTEESSKATSYIPTNGATVTRLADKPQMINSTLINQSEGVLYIESRAINEDLRYRELSLCDGTANYRITIGYDNANNLKVYVNKPNEGGKNIFIGGKNILEFHKTAVKYDQTGVYVYCDGDFIGSYNMIFGDGIFDRIVYGANSSFTNIFDSETRNISYFPKTLSDADLIRLTS